MVYTIYRTVNKVNGKYYLGKHQTENPNDDYLGSGLALKAAIKKYGRASFTKEVLFVFDNEHEMNLKEKELITERLVADKNSYNKGVGGEGGPHFKGRTHTKETIEKFSNTMRGRTLSDDHRLAVSNSLKGHKLSNETKEKLSQKQKERYKRDKSTT